MEAIAPRDAQFEAIRMLGQWSILARHFSSGGCSCCPGYIDADSAQIEQSILQDLRLRHAGVAESGDLASLLRALAFPVGNGPLPARDAILSDLARMFEALERARLGL